jgi:TonB family protein
MGNNKLFKLTLLISLLFHAAILFPMPKFQKKEKADTAFLNYLALSITQPKPVEQNLHDKTNLSKPEKTKKNYRTIKSSNNKKVKKQIARKSEPSEKVEIAKPVKEKKQEDVEQPRLPKKKEQDLSKDKFYITYYKLINEILRDAVIYPSDFSEGEIALTFILNADGSLVNVDVLQDTSYNNNSLRETAKQIVKNAAPFPPFPKELRQNQLSFNVVFCFRERS